MILLALTQSHEDFGPAFFEVHPENTIPQIIAQIKTLFIVMLFGFIYLDIIPEILSIYHHDFCCVIDICTHCTIIRTSKELLKSIKLFGLVFSLFILLFYLFELKHLYNINIKLPSLVAQKVRLDC